MYEDIFKDVRYKSDEEIQQFIIVNFGSARFVNPKDVTLLHIAAEHTGNSRVINILISMGVYVDSTDHNKYTPLHIAAMEGIVDAIDSLITNNAKIEAPGPSGETPLSMAIFTGKIDAVKTLLSHGANVNANLINANGCFTPLHLAIFLSTLAAKKHNCSIRNLSGIDIIPILISYGADTEAKNKWGKTALESAKSDDISIEDSQYLVGVINEAKENYLKRVIEGTYNEIRGKSDEEIKQFVREKLGDPNTPLPGGNGAYILHALASRKGNSNIIRVVVSMMESPNVIDIDGSTPLHYASRGCIVDAIESLLSCGATPNVKDSAGQTPLHDAARLGKADAIVVLISFGADTDVKESHGDIPIQMAVKFGMVDAVKVLLPHVSDINVKDKEGHTLLALVMRNKNFTVAAKKDIVRLLIEKGVDIFDLETNQQILAYLKGIDDIEMIAYFKDVFEKALSDKIYADYKERLENNPNEASLYQQRGLDFMHNELYAQAIVDFTKCLQIDREYGDALYLRALAYGFMGEWDNCIADYSQVILKNQEDWRCFSGRGYCYFKTGKYDLAKQDLERTLALNPSDEQCLANAKDVLIQINEVEKSKNIEYNKLVLAMNRATTEQEFQELSKQFKKLNGYMDSADKAKISEDGYWILNRQRLCKEKYESLVREMKEAKTLKDFADLTVKFREKDMQGYEHADILADECERMSKLIRTPQPSPTLKSNRIATIVIICCIVLIFTTTLIFKSDILNKLKIKDKGSISEVNKVIQTATVTSDVRFRAKPSTDADIISTLSKGDIVTVTGEVLDGWTPVSFKGSDGWIRREYLMFEVKSSIHE